MLFDHKNNAVSILENTACNKKMPTEKQGQYLAFIYYYTRINGQPPAEKDIQRYFNVSPPSVHRMIVELEKKKLVSREIGKARTLRLTIPIDQIPQLI